MSKLKKLALEIAQLQLEASKGSVFAVANLIKEASAKQAEFNLLFVQWVSEEQQSEGV
jgi:hypothetical protein